MSKLATFGREIVEFDASNAQHRAWFKEFYVKKTWKNCPVRFNLEEHYVNVVAMIQDHLTAYYMSRETFINE